MRNASASISRPARWRVLLTVALALPVLVACGGDGTKLVAQPQEMLLIDDCSQATIYVDRIVAGLWNRLCPAQPIPMEGVTFDMQTGEYRIQATIRGHDLDVRGSLQLNGPLSHGIHTGETATTIFTVVADDMRGEGHLYISPDAKFSLRVWGEILFENGRCAIEMRNIDLKGYAAGTTARLWGHIPFETREFQTGDRFNGTMDFEPTLLEELMPPPRMDASRYHGDPPHVERTQYEVHLDPQLFRILG